MAEFYKSPLTDTRVKLENYIHIRIDDDSINATPAVQNKTVTYLFDSLPLEILQTNAGNILSVYCFLQMNLKSALCNFVGVIMSYAIESYWHM